MFDSNLYVCSFSSRGFSKHNFFACEVFKSSTYFYLHVFTREPQRAFPAFFLLFFGHISQNEQWKDLTFSLVLVSVHSQENARHTN